MSEYPRIGDEEFRRVLFNGGYTPEELTSADKLMEDTPEALKLAYDDEPKITFGELEDVVCVMDLEGDSLALHHLANVSTGIIANFTDGKGFSQTWLSHGSIYGYTNDMSLPKATFDEISEFLSDRSHQGVKPIKVPGYDRGLLAVSNALVRNGHLFIRQVVTQKQKKRALDIGREPYYQEMKAYRVNGEAYTACVDAERIILNQRLTSAELFYGDKSIATISAT